MPILSASVLSNVLRISLRRLPVGNFTRNDKEIKRICNLCHIKNFIPCICLYKGNAVKGLRDHTIVDTNPAALAKFYSDNNADGLIIYDMSEGDAEHEEAHGYH